MREQLQAEEYVTRTKQPAAESAAAVSKSKAKSEVETENGLELFAELVDRAKRVASSEPLPPGPDRP